MARTKDGTAYEITGPQGAAWVVLIHGLGLTHASTWGGIAPTLAQEFQILSYDLLGHGETDLPSGRVDLKRLGQQVIDLMDELSIDRAALVGFSLGGMINRRVAIDHPNRVSALGILNAPHERGEKQQRLVEERARASSAEGPSANIDTTLARWFTPDFRVHSSQQVAALRDIVVANDPKNYAIHRQILAEGVTELIRPTPALKQPSLIMTCQNDSGSTPAMSQAIAQEIMDSELSILPKLQHLGLLEDPNAFAGPLLAFLRSKLPEG